MTRADSPWAGHRHRQQTCGATGAVAGVDFISIGNYEVPALVTASDTFCGREG